MLPPDTDAPPLDQLSAQTDPVTRLLTAAKFHRLAGVSSEVRWFAKVSHAPVHHVSPNAIHNFIRFTGTPRLEEVRTVPRAHITVRRDELARRSVGGLTIRYLCVAFASMFDHLWEQNAVSHNPVRGVEQPKRQSGDGRRTHPKDNPTFKVAY